ncbi:MAG: uroporphyrinogen-III synthase [Bacteroidales bacterium]
MRQLFSILLFGSILFSGCTEHLPLQDKRIVITAPKIYAKRLRASLEKYGATVTAMPTIETLVYDSLVDMSGISDSLGGSAYSPHAFDFVVLPSRNAISAYDNQMKKAFGKNIPYHANYYVLGKDKEYLEELGYTTPVDVPEPSMMGILSYIEANKEYKGKEMLLVAPKVSIINEPNVIPQFIREAQRMGITCNKVQGYTTQPVTTAHTRRVLKGIREGEYDMIAFSSGGEAFALAKMCNISSLTCKMACFGPYTANNAELAGIQVDMIAKNFRSFDDYAKSIARFFNLEPYNSKHPQTL